MYTVIILLEAQHLVQVHAPLVTNNTTSAEVPIHAKCLMKYQKIVKKR